MLAPNRKSISRLPFLRSASIALVDVANRTQLVDGLNNVLGMALALVKPVKVVEDYGMNDHIVRALEERIVAAELRQGSSHLVINLKKVLLTL